MTFYCTPDAKGLNKFKDTGKNVTKMARILTTFRKVYLNTPLINAYHLLLDFKNNFLIKKNVAVFAVRYIYPFNLLQANISFLYFLKTSENLWNVEEWK